MAYLGRLVWAGEFGGRSFAHEVLQRSNRCWAVFLLVVHP